MILINYNYNYYNNYNNFPAAKHITHIWLHGTLDDRTVCACKEADQTSFNTLKWAVSLVIENGPLILLRSLSGYIPEGSIREKVI